MNKKNVQATVERGINGMHTLSMKKRKTDEILADYQLHESMHEYESVFGEDALIKVVEDYLNRKV